MNIRLLLVFLFVLLSFEAKSEETLHFIHTDHLGTPVMLTDMDQNVVWKVESQTPFGEMVVNEDPDGDGNVVEFDLRFPGQYYDKETGTNYNWHRTYDPSLGRYLTSDPIGLSDGPNTYSYVQNNPINRFDPNGEAAFCLVPGVGWVACGVAAAGAGLTVGACYLTGTCQQLSEALGNVLSEEVGDDAESASDDPDYCPPRAGNEDPCRGLRRQLRLHENKLRDFISDPLSMDNRGFLSAALQSGNNNRYQRIVDSRINSLQRQIDNFRRQLQECERRYGGGT
ncbi:MAG: RHS domain-containing protein [Acidiferrobacterales bacterium]|nr:RHS domain-containing protein [Acidiferrobacterales bacterium]